MDTFSPAVELAQAVRDGVLHPTELLEMCLAQVDRWNPVLNAVIWRNDEEARHAAAQLAARFTEPTPPSLLLAGIPVPIKDLTAVVGWPLTYGSAAVSDEPRAEDEMVVTALRAAGAILAGRTNTPELGPLPAAENVRYGITRNPWDPSRTSGGSSGGAAAAVAAGMFPMAHANDGAGSIRIPASCCGLVGLKPSRGRVPATVASWLGAVAEGVVTRTVADTASALDAISGTDPLGWFTAPPPARPFAAELGADPGRLRIAILTRPPLDLPVAPEPLQAVSAAAHALEAAGHYVEPVDFDLFPADLLLSFLPIMNVGISEYTDVDFSRVEPHNAAAFAQAEHVSSVTMVRALADLQRFSRKAGARFGRDFDLLLTPTMAIEPPPAGRILEQVTATPGTMPVEMISMGVFTAPFNVSGQPAVSVPVHWTPQGIPVGVQLAAAPWREDLLIQVASQLEQALPWALRRPPDPGAPTS